MKKVGLEHVLERRFQPGLVFIIDDPTDSDHNQIYMCRESQRTGITIDDITFNGYHKPWFVYAADVPDNTKIKALVKIEPTTHYDVILAHLRKHQQYLVEAAKLELEIHFDLKHKDDTSALDRPAAPLSKYGLYFKDKVSGLKVDYCIFSGHKILVRGVDTSEITFTSLHEAKDYVNKHLEQFKPPAN